MNASLFTVKNVLPRASVIHPLLRFLVPFAAAAAATPVLEPGVANDGGAAAG